MPVAIQKMLPERRILSELCRCNGKSPNSVRGKSPETSFCQKIQVVFPGPEVIHPGIVKAQGLRRIADGIAVPDQDIDVVRRKDGFCKIQTIRLPVRGHKGGTVSGDNILAFKGDYGGARKNEIPG